jgi:predicted DNA-binding transcriptional regulator YafY
MPYIAERLLRLLSLLNAGHTWRGEDLAKRMGVTPRTVRRDVDHLRDLGYEVRSLPGPTGGYRLGAGTALPPMLLDDEAAVAVAVGLRAAADGAVTGMEEAGRSPALVRCLASAWHAAGRAWLAVHGRARLPGRRAPPLFLYRQ